MTLGPFYINDLVGTTSTQATLGFFNTGTAVSLAGNDFKIQSNAHVTGMYLVSDAARTAGSATARVRLAGVATAFNGDSVALDATNTTSDSGHVAPASGVAVTAGQTVGCTVISVLWTPTTADLDCWVELSYD